MRSKEDIETFRTVVWDYAKKNGRNSLPWRAPFDPYRVLVSEMMLQQTQVSRVIPKFNAFIKRFPTVEALAKANFVDVVREWNGLGYNRRAKFLHEAAKEMLTEHGGNVPRDYPSLRALPGLGSYTANAVRVFGFDEAEVLIETNIRTAIINQFFPRRKIVPDLAIERYAAAAAQGQDPRRWHSALMDYGAHLKALGIRLNARTEGYARQSKFEGSLREVRGAILRELSRGPSFVKKLPFQKQKIEKALVSLQRDGMVKNQKGKWEVA